MYHQTILKRNISILLMIVFLFSNVIINKNFVFASKDNSGDSKAIAAQEFQKTSDPDTSNEKIYFSSNTLENGRLWTDKTVNADRVLLQDIDGKPLADIQAEEDEFLITLSALSQSYSADAIMEPSDTVFILDISGSMYSNRMDNGKTRVEEMVEALNKAIQILMDANPDNRVAVVAYGGHVVGGGNGTKICNILKLGNYQLNDSQYFYMRSANQVAVSNQIPDTDLIDPAHRRVTVEGGTPTQRGIYAGAQVLMNNDDITHTTMNKGEETTVTRKPNIVLLTDGEPTFGWSNYKITGEDSDTAHDLGNGSIVDLGLDTLTILTASYWKQKVQEHYYDKSSKKAAEFYTIGLDVDGVHASAVLEPKNNVQKVTQSFNGTNYNLKTILDDFTNSPGTKNISFPAVEKNKTSRKLITVQNSNNYIKDYHYTNGYYSAKNAADLEDAFFSIAQRIISKGSYTTHVGPDDDPDFDGQLVISDVFGEYMELKSEHDLWFDGELYDGYGFAKNIVNDKTLQEEYIEDMAGQQDFMTTALAKSLLDSCMAAGSKGNSDGLYCNSKTDFSNKIRYYADFGRGYVGNYFSDTGDILSPPEKAACIVDIYTMAGEALNPVTQEKTDLMKIGLHLVTALKKGDYSCIEADDDELTRKLVKGQQAVHWHIPASLIPLRTVEPEFDKATGKVKQVEVKEIAPVRIIYGVGPKKDLSLDEVKAQYKKSHQFEAKGSKTYRFYSNAWENSPHNSTVAYYHPNEENSYYFYTETEADTKGKISLFVKKGDNYTQATSYQKGVKYYTESEYFDANADGYLIRDYILVDEEITEISNKSGIPYIEAGETKKEAFDARTKLVNATETSDYVADKGAYTIDKKYLQLHLLGNNGYLEVVETLDGTTDLTIEKKILGLGKSQYPKDLSFLIVGIDEDGRRIFTQSVKYSEFHQGKFTIKDIPIGAYTITEESGSVKGFKMEVTPSSVNNVIIESGDSKKVLFTNKYTPKDTPETSPEQTSSDTDFPTPITGDFSAGVIYLLALIAIVSLIIMIAAVARRKK